MKNVIITVLSIAVIVLGGYLVYDKVIDKEEKNNNEIKTPESNESIDFDTVAAKKFIDELVDLKVFNIFNQLSENGLTEENKLLIAIHKTSPQSIYTCSDAFDMNTSNNMEYRPTANDHWGCYSNQGISSYGYDLVNEQYKKLFGSSDDAKKVGIYITTAYEYSSKIDSYVSLTPYFGPIINNSYYYNIESAKITDNKLSIEISYLAYFPVSLDSEDEFSYVLDGNTNTFNIDEISTVFNNNKNSLPHLIFNYEKENENYVLKSVN